MKKMKKPFYKKIWFWVVVIIIIGAVSSGTDESQDTSNNIQKESTENKESAENKVDNNKTENGKVNYDNFLKIKMGQSYTEVVEILGEGKEQSSSDIAGIKTVIYSWDGSLISNMNVTVQDDVVVGKAQVGLKSMDAKITLDKYNKVESGISYDELKAIVGEGEVSSETKIMDSSAIIYSYINKGASNANFTFTNGKMSSKAQFNLK